MNYTFCDFFSCCGATIAAKHSMWESTCWIISGGNAFVLLWCLLRLSFGDVIQSSYFKYIGRRVSFFVDMHSNKNLLAYFSWFFIKANLWIGKIKIQQNKQNVRWKYISCWPSLKARCHPLPLLWMILSPISIALLIIHVLFFCHSFQTLVVSPLPSFFLFLSTIPMPFTFIYHPFTFTSRPFWAIHNLSIRPNSTSR